MHESSITCGIEYLLYLFIGHIIAPDLVRCKGLSIMYNTDQYHSTVKGDQSSMDEAPKQPADAGENTAEFTPLALAQEQLDQAADEARSTYDESRPVKQRRFRVAARTSVIRHDKERATPPADDKPTRS